MHPISLSAEQTAAHFRQIGATEVVGMLEWNTDGQITDANDTLLNMIGYSRAELEAGKLSWRTLTPPEFHELDDIAYQRLLNGEAVVPYEKQYFHKDGHRIDILIRSSLYPHNKDKGIACVVDITERKRGEEELAESREVLRSYAAKLESNNQELSQLLEILTHGLRVPVQAEYHVLQQLQSGGFGALNPQLQSVITELSASNRLALDMLNNIVSAYKFRKNGRPLTRTVLPLDKVAEEYLQSTDIQAILAERSQKVEFTKEGHDFTVAIAPAEIRLVLLNLLRNAARYSPEHATLSLKITAQETAVEFSIFDPGPGVHEKIAPYLFEPFAAMHEKKYHQVGTGLGLYLCRKIVEAHGGRIRYSRPETGGSLFSFYLPK